MINEKIILAYIDDESKQYFFSDDYLNSIESRFIPYSFYIPHNIKRHDLVKDGIVKSKKDIKKAYFSNYTEIIIK